MFPGGNLSLKSHTFKGLLSHARARTRQRNTILLIKLCRREVIPFTSCVCLQRLFFCKRSHGIVSAQTTANIAPYTRSAHDYCEIILNCHMFRFYFQDPHQVSFPGIKPLMFCLQRSSRSIPLLLRGAVITTSIKAMHTSITRARQPETGTRTCLPGTDFLQSPVRAVVVLVTLSFVTQHPLSVASSPALSPALAGLDNSIIH